MARKQGLPRRTAERFGHTALAVRFPVVSHVSIGSRQGPDTYRQLRTMLV